MPRPMVAGMVPDAWVQEAASKLIEQHGADAKTEVERLLSVVITQRNQDRILLIVRIGVAVAARQGQPNDHLRRMAAVFTRGFLD